jgi:hypothetical protein
MLVCMVVMTSQLTSETHISNGVQCHPSPNVLSFWHKIGGSHTSRQTRYEKPDASNQKRKFDTHFMAALISL